MTTAPLLIAKFASKRDELQVERAEVATLRLARMAGLSVPDARLAEIDGRAIALIRRFDRGPPERPDARIPYISAQTMLGAGTATDGTYEAIAEAIREHCSEPAAQLEQLFRRVAFTVLVSNTDDHLSNHGFVHTGNRQWGLSPVFDVNPSPQRESRHKTPISAHSGDAADIGLLIDHAALFDICNAEAKRMTSAMAEVIKTGWRDAARDVGMTPPDMDGYRPAFENRNTDLALRQASVSVPVKPVGHGIV